jgi:quercetin dioxygenase-like cupin family protein
VTAFQPLDGLPLEVLGEGVHTRILRGDRITVVYVELEPDSAVAEHAHDNEQLGVLLSGSMAFRIGDEVRDIGAGDGWVIPPDVPHGVDRTGPEGATLIEAFAPARTDWDQLQRVAPRELRGALGGSRA